MNSEIEAYLEALKAKGLSAPAGIHWDRLCKLLLRYSKVDDSERLQNPLILGGDIASHAVKHERLTHHLEWAERHKCLKEAIFYLDNLAPEKWNRSNGSDWNEEHPWVRGEE